MEYELVILTSTLFLNYILDDKFKQTSHMTFVEH